MTKNTKVCLNHFKFGRSLTVILIPFSLTGYDREKAPIDRLPVQPIRTKKEKSDTEKRNNIATPKKLLWYFTVLFLGQRRSLLYSNTVQRSFFPIAIHLILGKL